MEHLRIALVTGANQGIGFEIVRQLASSTDSLQVYLGARDEGRGTDAVQKLKNEYSLSNVHFIQLDITDKASVDKAAEHIKTKHGGLDILVNNAGMAFKGDAFDENVARTTLGTNFFGTVNVTSRFLPLVRNNGRVVNVSSRVGQLRIIPSEKLKEQFADPHITLEQLTKLVNQFIEAVKDGTFEEKGWPRQAYGISKVAMSTYVEIVAREEKREGVIVTACCPGWVRTSMAGPRAPLTPAEGAETPVWLALLPNTKESEKHHGGFFYKKERLDWKTATMKWT